MDDEPIITDLIEKIKKKLSGFVPAKYQDVLVNQLLGWWERQVIAHLKGESTSPIPRNEVQAQITDIIVQCRDDNLPIFSEFDPAEGDVIGNEKNFVRQLHIIDKGDRTKKHAKRNYYLASKHRSEWVRIDPLIKRDIERYDETLTTEWGAKYEDMMDNVGDRTTEKTKKYRGSELFEWANDRSDYLCIRPLCKEPFVRRGTFHILSDNLQIGWHPDFKKHLN